MKRIAPILIFCFLLTFIQPVKADSLVLPKPGTMVNVSPSFVAPTLRGIKVHRDDPFRFDFVLDQGDQKSPVSKPEATKLVKYFLAAVTTPYGDLWVNLSPYEKDRIVPQSFGQTEMGRDLLAQDYILKQLTASIIYPESQTGKEFWAKVYAQAKERFGTATVPINTFNKVWIVPSEAEVYENPTSGSAYIVKSSLKVMMEQDYLASKKNVAGGAEAVDFTRSERGSMASSPATPRGDGFREDKSNSSVTGPALVASDVIREVVLPLLQREINEGKNFATVRQVYNSLILATWYKKKLKDSVISQAYANQNKVAGIKFNDDQTNEKIYQQYIEAFKVGAYNYIKEEQDPLTQKTIPRKYFSGGASFGNIDKTVNITNKAMSAEQVGKRQFVVEANLAFSGSVPLDKAMSGETRRKFLSRAGQIAVAGTVLALAGSDEQKIESVIMQGYSDDEKAELEAIQRAQLKDKEGVAQLLKFTDKMQKKLLQIRLGMDDLQKVLSKDADSNVVIIYQSENENLVPEPLAQGEANLDATATAIKNLLTEQGKGMINLPLTITAVTEAVLHGIADPWTMLKRANPDAFKNRKIFYVRISPDTLKNATKYRAAMDAIRTHARIEGKPIVAISKRDGNTPMLTKVEIVGKRESPSIVLVGGRGFSPEVKDTILPLVTGKASTDPKAQLITALLRKGKKEVDAFEKNMNEMLGFLRKYKEIDTVAFTVTALNPRDFDLERAKTRWAQSEQVINAIFASSSRKWDNEDELKQYAIKAARALVMSGWENLVMRDSTIFKDRKAVQLVIPTTSEAKDKVAKIQEHVIRSTFWTARDNVPLEYIKFFDEITAARNSAELEGVIKKRAMEIQRLKDALMKVRPSDVALVDERLTIHREHLALGKQFSEILSKELENYAKQGKKVLVLTGDGLIADTQSALESNLPDAVVEAHYLSDDRAMLSNKVSRRKALVATSSLLAGGISKAQDEKKVEVVAKKENPSIVLVGGRGFSPEVRDTIRTIATSGKTTSETKGELIRMLNRRGIKEANASEKNFEEILDQLKQFPDIYNVAFVTATINSKDFDIERAKARWVQSEKIIDSIFASSSQKWDNEEELKKQSVRLIRAIMMSDWENLVMRDSKIFVGRNTFQMVHPSNPEEQEIRTKLNQLIVRSSFWVAQNGVPLENIKFFDEIRKSRTISELEAAIKAHGADITRLESILAKAKPEDVILVQERIALERKYVALLRDSGIKLGQDLEVYAKQNKKVLVISGDGLVDGARAKLEESFPDIFVKTAFLSDDKAMLSQKVIDNEQDSYGGIDFNDLDIGLTSNGQDIKFNLSPETLQKTQSAPGLTPIILNILPLSNLKEFLQ